MRIYYFNFNHGSRQEFLRFTVVQSSTDIRSELTESTTKSKQLNQQLTN